MKPTDAVRLTRLVKALCPAQAWDEATPDVWVVLMREAPYDDAEAAVGRLGAHQRFIAPAEVLAEIKRLRSERLVGIDDYRSAFPGNPDDVHAELDWWRGVRKRVADGEPSEEVFTMPALVARKMPAIEGAFRRVPRK